MKAERQFLRPPIALGLFLLVTLFAEGRLEIKPIAASSGRLAAMAIRSSTGGIMKALVSFMVSFISLYVIRTFFLCKNASMQSFSGETT